MRITDRARLSISASVLTLLILIAGCADPTQQGAIGSAGSEVPASLHEILSRDNLQITDSSFAGGLSADETLAAFRDEYDPGLFENEAMVYAVEIVASEEARLKPSTAARMVHIPGVLQTVEVPSSETDAQPSPTTISTDMFTFFDAETGAHLVTVYIGPPASA